MEVQEELLRQLLTDSKAYGSLLGSGGVGDPGRISDTYPACYVQAVMCCGACINIDNISTALLLMHLIVDAEKGVLTLKQYDVFHCAMSFKIKLVNSVFIRRKTQCSRTCPS